MIHTEKNQLQMFKINNLIRQNQQLKMQFTQLKNAFGVNRQVLSILAGKSEPSKRIFYIMLKKMNQHNFELSQTVIQLKKQRIENLSQIKRLEVLCKNLEGQLVKNSQQINDLRKKISQSFLNGVRQDKGVEMEVRKQNIFSPKEIHLILTQQIRNITNQLFILGDLYSQMKKENQKLKKYIQNFQTGAYSGRNSKIGSSRNLSEDTINESFKKRVFFQTENKNQKQIQQTNSEQDQWNCTQWQLNSQRLGDQRKSYETQKFDLGLNNSNRQVKKEDSEIKQRVLRLQIQKLKQEIRRLKLNNEQLKQRVNILIVCKKISMESKEKLKVEMDKIMELIQWRYNIGYLDNDDKKFIYTIHRQKSKSLQK